MSTYTYTPLNFFMGLLKKNLKSWSIWDSFFKSPFCNFCPFLVPIVISTHNKNYKIISNIVRILIMPTLQIKLDFICYIFLTSIVKVYNASLTFVKLFLNLMFDLNFVYGFSCNNWFPVSYAYLARPN